MKAWQCDDARPVPGLIATTVEMPAPGPGELLIQIHAAGVTPTELQWFPTTHSKDGAARHHAIPGHEFSGVIAGVGPGASGKAGQEVFGMNDWFAQGATAEFCCASESAVARNPARLTHAEAASVPIAALTAWQGLFARAGLRAGERVLIHGGAGAVGVLAVQLARWRGAQVIATASARHHDFLMALGAHQVIDYQAEPFELAASGVDVVFDTVGGATLQRSWQALNAHGRLVTIAASSEGTSDARTKDAFFIVESNREQLQEIGGLLEEGVLKPIVDAVVPFEQTADAYARRLHPRRGCGKMVIAVIS